MLLAEALVMRADKQKRLKELTARIEENARLPRAERKAGTRQGRGIWVREGDSQTRAAVDVRALQERADEWAVRYREIDVRLQQLNWSTDLVE